MAIVLAVVPSGVFAGDSSTTVSIQVSQRLIVVATPTNPTVACNDPAGEVVAAIAVTGGNGKPITLGMTGATTDFALSGSTPPANVVIAPGGITVDSCSTTLPATETVTITATQ